MQYRHLHKGTNTNDDAESCKNLVNLGAVTAKDNVFHFVYLTIELIGQKSAYDLYSSRWHSQTRWTIKIIDKHV